jgi:hypothetical protein
VWHPFEPGSGHRWTAASRSRVAFTLAAPIALQLTIDASPLRAETARTIDVVVNGATLGSTPIEPSLHSYDWTVPAGALRAGYNTIDLIGPAPATPRSLGMGDDDRALGLAVRSLRLRRLPS